MTTALNAESLTADLAPVHSRFVIADGLRTHFLEAGDGFPVILLHSGDIGSCAELSWEKTIQPLATKFRVVAPDWSGYGQTEKVLSIDDVREFRIRHITALLRVLGVERAHFIGNSMGGTLLLQAMAATPCPWHIDKAVVVAGGGQIPENDARRLLDSYDGTLDHMRRIVDMLFVDPAIRNDAAYVERRHSLSREPGAWEAMMAARLRAPWREIGAQLPRAADYSHVTRPVLLVTGDRDPLRLPGFGTQLQSQIPGSQLYVFEDAGHCPHLERPGEFNEVVTRFLLEGA